MRRSLVLVVLAMIAMATRAHAQDAREWFTGSVGVASDYAFRGLSQTGAEPAIQGGMDLTHPTGLYLGVWGSSVNFGEELTAGPRAQMEMDLYGGVRHSLAGVADFDLGLTGYLYPGAADSRKYDFLEVGLGAGRSVGAVSGALTAKYSPDFFASSGSAIYYGAQLAVPVSFLTLSGSVGHQNIEDNAAFGTPDYSDFGLGVSVGWEGFELSGSYLTTDLGREECFGGSDLCGSRFVLGLGRSL